MLVCTGDTVGLSAADRHKPGQLEATRTIFLKLPGLPRGRAIAYEALRSVNRCDPSTKGWVGRSFSATFTLQKRRD